MIPRLFMPKPTQRVTGSTKPADGHTVRYNGEPYYLALHNGKFRIFDAESKRYIELERQRIVPDPDRPNAWVYDANKPVTQKPTTGLKSYMVTVTINGEVTNYDVKSESEGRAKNKVAGILAGKLKLTIQGVHSLLKMRPNSISVKEL